MLSRCQFPGCRIILLQCARMVCYDTSQVPSIVVILYQFSCLFIEWYKPRPEGPVTGRGIFFKSLPPARWAARGKRKVFWKTWGEISSLIFRIRCVPVQHGYSQALLLPAVKNRVVRDVIKAGHQALQLTIPLLPDFVSLFG
jgi:hypothetical protein